MQKYEVNTRFTSTRPLTEMELFYLLTQLQKACLEVSEKLADLEYEMQASIKMEQ